MARSHFWQHLLNSEGQPISGATVTLYEDVSGDIVNFYPTLAGGSPLSATQTNKYGFFEMFVPDKEIPLENGYATNTTFTLNVSSASLGVLEPITGIQLLFQPPRVYFGEYTGGQIARTGNINSVLVTHNLNTDYPLVNAWLDTTNVPVSCTSLDNNSLTASASSVSAPTKFYVNVVGKDL